MKIFVALLCLVACTPVRPRVWKRMEPVRVTCMPAGVSGPGVFTHSPLRITADQSSSKK